MHGKIVYTPSGNLTIKNGKYTVLKMYLLLKNGGFPIAMLDYQRVIASVAKTLGKHAPYLEFCMLYVPLMYSMLYMSDLRCFLFKLKPNPVKYGKLWLFLMVKYGKCR